MTRTVTQAALAAKSIRKELKEHFPHVKFSVKSENYAGGNGVNISWDNGVTDKVIKNIVDKYQYGHFNGMEDIYEYSNTIEDLPQVKFVFTRRIITQDIVEKAFQLLKQTLVFFEGVENKNDYLHSAGFHNTPSSYLKFNYLRKCDLSEGFKPEMVSCEVYNNHSY